MDRPYSLQAIVESLLVSVSERVPNIYYVVFAGRKYYWNIGMKGYCGDIILMAIIKCE